MRYMVFKIIFLVFCAFIFQYSGFAYSADADNPLIQYKKTRQLDSTTEDIWVVHADISGDGLEEILISHKGSLRQTSGVLWDVYTPDKGRYKRLNGGAIFHKGDVNIAGVNGDEAAIYTLSHLSAEESTIVKITLEGDRIVQKGIRKVNTRNNPEDAEFSKSLFVNNKLNVTYIPFDEIETFDLSSIVSPPPSSQTGFVSQPLDETDLDKKDQLPQVNSSTSENNLLVDTSITDNNLPVPDSAANTDEITPLSNTSDDSKNNVLKFILVGVVCALGGGILLLRKRNKDNK